MPRNGSGTFVPYTNSWYPVTGATTSSATAADWGTQINDIRDALTQSLSSDGQTALSGNLNFNSNKATNLASASASGHAIVYGQGSWSLGAGTLTGALTMNTPSAVLMSDATSYISDDGDATKRAQFQASGITTGTTRTYTFPDKSGTFAMTSDVASVALLNDFRLTLTSATPVTTADVTGAGTVYCTPYKGNRIALYDGSTWNLRTSAEFSLALSALTSGKPYDIFCYDNATVPTLEFLVWTNDTTRATALVYQDGVLVKSGATTRRYLGTMYTTGVATTEDSYAKRYLWNYYHRVLRQARGTFSADRTTTSATFAEINSEIRTNFLVGVSEDALAVNLIGTATSDTANCYCGFAPTFDGISTETALEGGGFNTSTTASKVNLALTGWKLALAAGRHYVTLCGKTDAGTQTFHSANAATTAKVYLSIGVAG